MAGLFFYESETNAVETFSAGRRHDALLWFWLVNHCVGVGVGLCVGVGDVGEVGE